MTDGWAANADFRAQYEERKAAARRQQGSPSATGSPTPQTWRTAMDGPQVYRSPSELTGWVNTSTLQGIQRVSNPFSGFYTKPVSQEEGINQFYNIYYGGNSQVRSALDAIARRQRSTPKGIWEDMVYLSQMSSAEGVYMTAMDHLYQVYSDFGGSGAGSSGSGSYYSGGGGYGGGGGGGGGSVSLTNPTSARGLLLQTMQGVLGRNPTEREYKNFLDTLTQTEMANPNTVSIEGDVAVQSGGTDPGMIAMDFAQSADDYKATQANKFYNAFMGALGGGLGG
jgi:hypothetical protein